MDAKTFWQVLTVEMQERHPICFIGELLHPLRYEQDYSLLLWIVLEDLHT